MTDASRLRVAGGAAVLLALAAAGTFYGTRDRAPGGPVGPAPPVAARGTIIPAELPSRTTQETAAAAPVAHPLSPEPRAARAAHPLRFDVVRTGARGMMVVAGRSMPGAEVLLLEGGREIGRARADGRGDWIILPADPIGAGPRELSLRARLPGGDEMDGTDTVLVVGPARPEPQPAAASAGAGERMGENPPDGSADGPLVLLLPPTAQAAPRALSTPGSGRPAQLGLDIVDYDNGNTMRFAGTAPPGAQLRLYSDGRHLGDTTADATGRWSLTPAQAPPIGRHMLRVDHLLSGPARPGAAVTGRIEVAFQREVLPAGAVRDGRVVVQPGHNLWRIARDSYGQGVRYTVIYQANQGQIRDPARIYPGQVFSLPDLR